jgi:hypothetical protein
VLAAFRGATSSFYLIFRDNGQVATLASLAHGIVPPARKCYALALLAGKRFEDIVLFQAEKVKLALDEREPGCHTTD